ncbi:hypothetical protein C8Q80DRAFT_500959 [Daedaleopsis nitida]|nr:hypothetical protein C8Q80DRAFT_500959 [Daedaleopsis nitida]
MPNPPPGMSSELFNSIQQLLSGYQGGPGSSIEDMMRHLSRQDPDTVSSLIDSIATATEEATSRVDLATFDFAALRVRPLSFWIVQLSQAGFADREGRIAEVPGPASLPYFQVIVYDERGTFRATEGNREPGLPSSDFVLTTVKKAMASPMPPLRPQLPAELVISRKLGGHVSALRPFLDSLPAPFSWRMETREEEEDVARGLHEENVKGYAKGLKNAEKEKELGNKAFANKDRQQALAHYTEAIESLMDALGNKTTPAETQKIKRLSAVCFPNRAATWLLPEEGQDAGKALEDAETAIRQDADYGKGYYRKAKAQQLLAQSSEAIDTLTAALSRASLSSEKGLNDALVEIYGGFPDTESDLRAFCLDKFKNENGDKRARDLVEFRRRADVQLKKVLGPDASVERL